MSARPRLATPATTIPEPRMLQSIENLAQHPLGALAFLAVGIIVLLTGGHALVHGAAAIARRMGWSTLVIGLTIVAFGTSAPELFFNIIAALNDHGELSFGNIVGSNIANIGLILGVTALFAPLVVHGRIVNKELPWLIVISLAILGLALFPFSGDDRSFDRYEAGLMLICFGLFTTGWYRLGKREAADPLVAELGETAEEESHAPLGVAWLLFVVGLTALLVGGKATEIGAVSVARSLGWSESLIGLTIVAIATSLPELTTCIIAVRKGHDDLAIGNLVGSNIFNLLLVLGVTAVIAPVQVPSQWGLWDLIAMNVITIMLLLFAMTNKYKVNRLEGGTLLLMYVVYMTFSVWRELGGSSTAAP